MPLPFFTSGQSTSYEPIYNTLFEIQYSTSDLNEYETEASDILFYIDLEITSRRPVEVKKQNQKFVKEILTEAFNIDLTNEECRIPAEKIYEILYEN